MQKIKIKQTIERTIYKKKCPYCPLVIKGNSESQTEYNLKTHIREKHKKRGQLK